MKKNNQVEFEKDLTEMLDEVLKEKSSFKEQCENIEQLYYRLNQLFMNIVLDIYEKHGKEREKTPAEYMSGAELNACYNILSFLEPLIKMADRIYRCDQNRKSLGDVMRDICDTAQKPHLFGAFHEYFLNEMKEKKEKQ